MFQLTRKIEYALIVLNHIIHKTTPDKQPVLTGSTIRSNEKNTKKGINEQLPAKKTQLDPTASLETQNAFLFTVKMIANQYGIPKVHTAKTFQILCRNGILASKQGAKGGYYLAKPLSTITLYDLIYTIEGNFGIVRCMTTDKSQNQCNYSFFCNIATPMQNLNDKLIHFYKNTTLDELLKNTTKNNTSNLKNTDSLRFSSVNISSHQHL
ncbi:hypothetical protein COTS27_01098 [Spirochaetota bacterium]|nr:hypothetical protein COTS27_01098 [Spirochaetota bacterium]